MTPNIIDGMSDVESRWEYHVEEAEAHRRAKNFLHTVKRFLRGFGGLPTTTDGYDKAYHSAAAEKQRLIVLVDTGSDAELSMVRTLIKRNHVGMKLEAIEHVSDKTKFKFKSA